jgi:hypothetical protein
MLLYPQISPRRERTLLTDIAVVVLVLALAWVGIKVHDGIDGLKSVTAPLAQAGTSVRSDFRAAANSISGVPIVGGQLASGLRRAGADTGGSAVAATQTADNAIDTAATLTGWLVFLLPTVILLARHVPARVSQVRRLNAAARVLGESVSPGVRRLVAERAAFSLPYQQLLRYSRQPLADLEQGHLDPLIAAALEDEGLRLR